MKTRCIVLRNVFFMHRKALTKLSNVHIIDEEVTYDFTLFELQAQITETAAMTFKLFLQDRMNLNLSMNMNFRKINSFPIEPDHTVIYFVLLRNPVSARRVFFIRGVCYLVGISRSLKLTMFLSIFQNIN